MQNRESTEGNLRWKDSKFTVSLIKLVSTVVAYAGPKQKWIQASGRVSVPCQHARSVEDALMETFLKYNKVQICQMSSLIKRSWIDVMYDWECHKSQHLEHMQVPIKTWQGIKRSKRSLLICSDLEWCIRLSRSLYLYFTRCKYCMETIHNLVKFKHGINAIKLVKKIWSVTITGHASEWHLSFARGRLQIV